MNKGNSNLYFFIKRAFDLLFSTLVFIFLFPIMLLVALLVYLKIDKNIFFIQERVGLNKRIFKIYKFKTMTEQKDTNGRLLADEIRLTKFGKILRSLSLDELPQLVNVFKGDLSLVGPRPLLVEYMPLYSKEQDRRHEVTAGITGWAQINGRNAISWGEKFKLDVWYVDNCSFLLDLKIILLTIIKVINNSDINSNSSATMERFYGN